MPRRRHGWFGKVFEHEALTTGDNLVQIASSTDLQGFGTRPTIARIRGALYFYHERSDLEDSQHSQWWVGITCLHEDLTQANLGFVSNIGEPHWMWSGFAAHHATSAQLRRGDTGATYNASSHWGSSPDFLDVDVKSMRKAPDPCELVMSIHQNQVGSHTGQSGKYSGYLRVLVKE